MIKNEQNDTLQTSNKRFNLMHLDIIPCLRVDTRKNKKCVNPKGVIFMSKRSKLSDEERIQAVKDYLDGNGGYIMEYYASYNA